MQRNGGCGQLITQLCSIRGRIPHTFPYSSMGSLAWETVLPELLQCGSFLRTAVLKELLWSGSCPQGAVLQDQAAPAWVPHKVTSAASTPAQDGLLSPWGHRAYYSVDFPQGHSLLQAPTFPNVGSSFTHILMTIFSAFPLLEISYEWKESQGTCLSEILSPPHGNTL